MLFHHFTHFQQILGLIPPSCFLSNIFFLNFTELSPHSTEKSLTQNQNAIWSKSYTNDKVSDFSKQFSFRIYWIQRVVFKKNHSPPLLLKILFLHFYLHLILCWTHQLGISFIFINSLQTAAKDKDLIFFFEVAQYLSWMCKSSSTHTAFEILLPFQAWYIALRSRPLRGHRKAPKLLLGCPFSTSLRKGSIRFNLYCPRVEKSKDKDITGLTTLYLN